MSGWNPHQLHPSVFQREHWLANNLYRRPTFDVIHINPGIFAWTYFLGMPAIIHFGMLALPFGEGLNAPPSNEDVGRVAACALADPSSYIGRCLRPTGPTLITPFEAAESMSRALGRRVAYKAVSERSFVKAARALHFPTFQIAQDRHYAKELSNGAFDGVSDHVEEVTGAPPDDFDAVAQRYFDDPSRIAPGMRRRSWLGALRLGLRIASAGAIDLGDWEQTRDYPLISSGRRADENPSWSEAAHGGQLSLLPEPAARQPLELPHGSRCLPSRLADRGGQRSLAGIRAAISRRHPRTIRPRMGGKAACIAATKTRPHSPLRGWNRKSMPMRTRSVPASSTYQAPRMTASGYG